MNVIQIEEIVRMGVWECKVTYTNNPTIDTIKKDDVMGYINYNTNSLNEYDVVAVTKKTVKIRQRNIGNPQTFTLKTNSDNVVIPLEDVSGFSDSQDCVC